MSASSSSSSSNGMIRSTSTPVSPTTSIPASPVSSVSGASQRDDIANIDNVEMSNASPPYTSASSPIMMSESVSAQTTSQPSINTIVINIGSKEIRFGTNEDWIGPQTIENCIAIPVKNGSKSTSSKKKKMKPENIRNKELLKIRGQLLADRKLLSTEKIEQEVYFEEITVKEAILQPQLNPHLLNAQQMKRPQLNSVEEVIPGAIFGKRVIEKVMANDSNEKYELYYPFWKGCFNVLNPNAQCHNVDSLIKTCELIEAILAYILKAILKLTSEKIHESRLVLILPDESIDKGKGKEIHCLLDIVFNKLQFSEVLIHKESVCAVFGTGASNACVVDLGETKTTLSVVEDGECVSRSELPYGGIHVSKTLLWILKQCNFPLSESVSFDNLADQQNLERIRNEYCHLEEGNEIFQHVDFIHNKQIYMMDIGDPLLLAPLAYFYPKLFGRECKLPETEQDPYAEIDDDNFWTEECLKLLHEQSLEPPSKKARLGKNKKKATGNKKGKKATKKTKVNKEEATAEEETSKAAKGKLKTALALHRAIIRLIKSSEMDVESKASKKKTISINILLIGGLSHMKGFRTALEKRLVEHYNNKNEGKQVKFTILTNDRDRNMDVRFLSWNGGLILSRVEASKKLWTTKKDYVIYREHVIDEKCAFVL